MRVVHTDALLRYKEGRTAKLLSAKPRLSICVLSPSVPLLTGLLKKTHQSCVRSCPAVAGCDLTPLRESVAGHNFQKAKIRTCHND